MLEATWEVQETIVTFSFCVLCLANTLLQPTLRRDDERKYIKACSSPREKTSGICHRLLFKENVLKIKSGLRMLKRRVWELFTHREGISTPHAHHEEQQPLIECAIKIT